MYKTTLSAALGTVVCQYVMCNNHKMTLAMFECASECMWLQIVDVSVKVTNWKKNEMRERYQTAVNNDPLKHKHNSSIYMKVIYMYMHKKDIKYIKIKYVYMIYQI